MRRIPTVRDDHLLIIFAKSPEAPNVKTRLATVLTRKERGQLQEAFILDTLSLSASLQVKRAMACTPDIVSPFFNRYKDKEELLLVKQKGRSFSERMKNVFQWGFSLGFKKVVLIGSDSPTLPTAFIQEAFDHLNTAPVVLGPATDGGYYLIGATPPLPQNLFHRIKWGTQTVLIETMKRLRYFHLLPFWYDLDRPVDLEFLKEHSHILRRNHAPFPKETWKTLKRK